MIVYIAGPYSPNNGYSIDQNIQAAELLARQCWNAAIPAICPHLNTAHMDDVNVPDVFYAGDLAILERCDAVLLVPGWEQSFGAKMERIHALRNRIPVFESFDKLLEYHKKWKAGIV